MHFSLEQFLWATLLAAHLVLLVILLGRDRAARFYWFAVAVGLSAARLLADHLLHGKLTTIAFYWQQYVLVLLSAIAGFLVLAELARRAFAHPAPPTPPLKPATWLSATVLSLGIAAAILFAIGPWPTLASITAEPQLTPLRIVWIIALKAEMLAGILAVLATFAILLFGRRFGTTLRSHATAIALGLSTIAISQITVQRIIEGIIQSAHPTSQADYQRTLRLLTNLDHARVVLWLLAVLWWIFFLWRDEPGTTPNPGPTPSDPQPELVPVGSGPTTPAPLQTHADLPDME